MSDKDRRNEVPPDYDLTTPNIYVPQGGQNARPSQPADPGDRTTINMPIPPRPEGGRPAERPAQGQNQYDLTMVNLGGIPYDEEEEPAPRPPQPAVQQRTATAARTTATPAQAARPARRGMPPWMWLGFGGLVVLLAGGVSAYLFLSAPAAFTLRVLNAPPGSEVYIDDIPSGVPQRDGTIIVQGLRAGEPREMRVAQAGHAEWKTTVTGESGETQDVTVQMIPLQAVAPTLPPEIDYNGKMMLVASGPFSMGFDGAGPDEAPAQSVELPAFYIDKFEVTNEQYAKFCEATGRPRPVNPFWDPQYFEANPRMPVVGVSYADAVAYAAWANKRLPIEAEWEKAASWGPGAASKRQYPWGGAVEPGRANLDSQHPTEVGAHPAGASAYGVMDMAGNAREWVDAYFAPYPRGSQSNPNYGKGLRVVRGGDFRAGPTFARTTARLGVAPEFKTNPGDDKQGRSSLIGFRCAISADDPRLRPHLQKR